MAVKIRLKRMGKKKQPTYRVVIADSRSPRDGRIIESIGRYDPRQEPSVVEIDTDRALHWLQTGARPTERAQKLLEISGAWAKWKISRGEVYTVPTAPEPKVVVVDVAPTDAPADDDPGGGTASADAAEAPAETDAPAEADAAPEATTEDAGAAGDEESE